MALKKNVAMVLWFLAGWFGASLFVGYGELPPALALLPGIVLAVLVRWDPTGQIWSRSVTGKRIVRTVRPINEVAAELDRKNAGAGMPVRSRADR